MDFRQVYAQYKSDLNSIDELLAASVRSNNAVLNHSSSQLLAAGGKRIRPLFALLCGELGELRNKTQIRTLAASLELVHMATLVHDDVIDDASVRRGHPTVRAQYGNRPAMYTGDFLLARAIYMLSSLANTEVHSVMSDALVKMCEGEIEQIRDFHCLDQSLKQYLRRIERKTALLISVSCTLGATVSGVSRERVTALRQFGHYTGMAFQIVDDILDYIGDENVIGKPIGNDLLQGNITLPALFAVQSSSSGEELRRLIHPQMSARDAKQAVLLIRDAGGIEYAEQLATRYLEKALDTLGGIPDAPATQALAVVARFVNQRMY